MDHGEKIMRILAVVMIIILLGTTAMADAGKGKRYYMKNFKQKFKMNGLDFVQLHTQAEWEMLFKDKGKGFIIEFSKKYPRSKTYLNKPKIWDKLQHVRDFAIMYANDSGKTPTCGGDAVSEPPFELEVQDSSPAGFF